MSILNILGIAIIVIIAGPAIGYAIYFYAMVLLGKDPFKKDR